LCSTSEGVRCKKIRWEQILFGDKQGLAEIYLELRGKRTRSRLQVSEHSSKGTLCQNRERLKIDAKNPANGFCAKKFGANLQIFWKRLCASRLNRDSHARKRQTHIELRSR
jgi:hypothetical protein